MAVWVVVPVADTMEVQEPMVVDITEEEPTLAVPTSVEWVAEEGRR